MADRFAHLVILVDHRLTLRVETGRAMDIGDRICAFLFRGSRGVGAPRAGVADAHIDDVLLAALRRGRASHLVLVRLEMHASVALSFEGLLAIGSTAAAGGIADGVGVNRHQPCAAGDFFAQDSYAAAEDQILAVGGADVIGIGRGASVPPCRTWAVSSTRCPASRPPPSHIAWSS